MPAVRDWSKMGSSYITGLLGDPEMFMTPIEIWLKMTKQDHLLPKNDLELNEALYWGSKLEDPIIDSFVEDNPGIELLRNKTLYMGDYFCDTTDGLQLLSGREAIALECKNVRQSMDYKWESFVPKYPYAQCQWHIKHVDAECIGLGIKPPEKCYVRALIGGCKKVDYVVPRDDTFITDIEVIAESFINDYVKTRKEPPIDCTAAYGDYLFAKFPEVLQGEKSFIEISSDAEPEIIQALSDLKVLTDTKKTLDSDIELRKNILKNRIGDSYGILSELGKVIWNMQKGRVSYKAAIDNFLELYPSLQGEFDRLIEDTQGKDSRTFRSYLK